MTWPAAPQIGSGAAGPGLCPLHAGIVPARIHLRSRPPGRRSRILVPDSTGFPRSAIGTDRLSITGHDDHQGLRALQAGRRVRLLRGPPSQRRHGHRLPARGSPRPSMPNTSARARPVPRGTQRPWPATAWPTWLTPAWPPGRCRYAPTSCPPARPPAPKFRSPCA